jgi:hypothetical protein
MAGSKKRGSAIAHKAKVRAKAKAGPSRSQVLNGVVNSQATMRYGDAERQARDVIARLGAHHGTIDSAFDAYKTELGQAAQRQAEAYRQAAEREQATATGVAGATADLGKGNQADLAAAAARYGMPAPDTHLLEQTGQLAAVSGLRAQANQGALETAGLAGQTAMQRHLGNLPAERLAAQTALGGKETEAGNALATLLGQEGAFKIDALDKLRQEDAQNKIAAQTLGLKAKEFDVTTELKKLGMIQDSDQFDAKLQFDESKLGADIKRYARQARQKDRELDIRAKNGDGKGPSVPGQRHDSRGGLLSPANSEKWYTRKSRILGIKRAFGSMASSGRYDNTAQMTVALKKAGYSTTEINFARDLAFGSGHRLSKSNIEVAKSYFPGGLIPQGFLASSIKKKG